MELTSFDIPCAIPKVIHNYVQIKRELFEDDDLHPTKRTKTENCQKDDKIKDVFDVVELAANEDDSDIVELAANEDNPDAAAESLDKFSKTLDADESSDCEDDDNEGSDSESSEDDRSDSEFAVDPIPRKSEDVYEWYYEIQCRVRNMHGIKLSEY